MDYLSDARQSLETYEDRINRERRYPDLEEASYRLTMMRAAIAQAEALQPRLIRIGDRIINLAHVTNINLCVNYYDDTCVIITLAAHGGEGAYEISWSGNQYEPVTKFLRELLQSSVIAEIDPPAKIYGWKPQAEPEPVSESSPLDNF